MNRHNGFIIGVNATQPLTKPRKVLVKSPEPEPQISAYVERRIRIERDHDPDAVPVFVGEAIRFELDVQGHDHVCVCCGTRLLEEVICPDCGTVPAWVRQSKGRTS